MSDLLALARRIESKHALFLFDSCFSGTIFKTRALPNEPPLISQLTSMPVRQFITAGDAGQAVPAKSVFAPALQDAIRYGLADLNNDSYVTGSELGMFLQDVVTNSSLGNQTPQYGKINDYELARGDFVFATRDLAAVEVAQDAPVGSASVTEKEQVKSQKGKPESFQVDRAKIIEKALPYDAQPPRSFSALTPSGRFLQVLGAGDDSLQIRTVGNSWVEVKDKNDRVLYGDLNQKGDVLEISGSAPFQVLIRRPEVASLFFNSRRIDLQPHVFFGQARLEVGGSPSTLKEKPGLEKSALALSSLGIKVDPRKIQFAGKFSHHKGVRVLEVGSKAKEKYRLRVDDVLVQANFNFGEGFVNIKDDDSLERIDNAGLAGVKRFFVKRGEAFIWCKSIFSSCK